MQSSRSITAEPAVPVEAEDALPLLRHRLGASLSAVYLHGSAVTGGGLRRWSDVDLLAVVTASLPATTRAKLSADLLAVSGNYPFEAGARRPLEVTLVRQSDLACLPYPARAEFIYGEWLRTAVENGVVPGVQESPDVTLLLAQARGNAVPLLGPDLASLVPDIPGTAIRQAIGDLLPELVRGADEDERNVLMTLARMCHTLTTGRFTSKEAAADWAASRLSARAAETLALAQRAHLGEDDDDLHRQREEVSLAIGELREHVVSALRASA